MKLTSPWTGLLSFIVVLFTMPLGHAAMILMEKWLGHQLLYPASVILGVLGVGMLIPGIYSKKELPATLLGLFGGLFVWTGWIEFAYVYFANRYHIPPLLANGEIVTKPEYLIMPSSVGLWAIVMLYYIFGTRSGCLFFSWIQRKLHYGTGAGQDEKLRSALHNFALTTFMELNMLLWTCYMVLLFAYDDRFFGDRHPVTVCIAFGALAWSLYLFVRLMKIKKLAYAIRYSIATVIIFWTFVEILGRWDILTEIWVEPSQYWVEMTAMLLAFSGLCVALFWRKHH